MIETKNVVAVISLTEWLVKERHHFKISLAGGILPIPPDNIPTRLTVTSFPGFSLLLERLLFAAGHLNPKIWRQTKIYLMEGVVNYKIFAVVRKIQNILERLQKGSL